MEIRLEILITVLDKKVYPLLYMTNITSLQEMLDTRSEMWIKSKRYKSTSHIAKKGIIETNFFDNIL